MDSAFSLSAIFLKQVEYAYFNKVILELGSSASGIRGSSILTLCIGQSRTLPFNAARNAACADGGQNAFRVPEAAGRRSNQAMILHWASRDAGLSLEPMRKLGISRNADCRAMQ